MKVTGQVCACALLSALPASVSYAAWETETLTAVEKGNPFDVHLSVGFDRTQSKGKIVREWIDDVTGQAQDVRELQWVRTEQRLLVGLRLGLYHDLEFHVLAPIVLNEDTFIRYAKGVEGASTIAGSINADDPNHEGTPRFPITGVTGSDRERYRAGFGDMIFGLAWSPFVDGKDEAWPTMTLRGDITAPTGSVRDPSSLNTLSSGTRGGIGLGQTIFDLSLAVSRRVRQLPPILDPYFIFGATIPVSSSAQQAKGMEAPATGRFLVGTELIVVEDVEDFQRYAIDLSFETRYIAAGRTYSPLSDYLPAFDQTKTLANRTGTIERPDQLLYSDFADPRNYQTALDGSHCGTVNGVPCGELNFVDEHVALTGNLGFNIRFAEFAMVRSGIALQYDSDHFLTNERVGKDLDPPTTTDSCDGAQCAGKVNARNSFYDRVNDVCPAGQTCDERSKYYDPRYDAPGRRFRIEDAFAFTFYISGVATF